MEYFRAVLGSVCHHAGPNAVNCISNGMTLGFRPALWGVLGILTQASLFLGLSAMGAVFNRLFRRVMAVAFIIYGVVLGSASVPEIRRG